MNPNIEIILHDLWGVNMEWVEAGFIPGVKLISGSKEIINLSHNGKIILDKQAKSYNGLVFFFKKAMQLSDDKLKETFQCAERFKDTDAGIDLWYNILGFEIKRRRIKHEYNKRILFNKAKKIGRYFLQKVGLRNGNDTIHD